MTSYFEKWEISDVKNLVLLNQPSESSHTALKSEISENGSDRYHFRRTGRTGTILSLWILNIFLSKIIWYFYVFFCIHLGWFSWLFLFRRAKSSPSSKTFQRAIMKIHKWHLHRKKRVDRPRISVLLKRRQNWALSR